MAKSALARCRRKLAAQSQKSPFSFANFFSRFSLGSLPVREVLMRTQPILRRCPRHGRDSIDVVRYTVRPCSQLFEASFSLAYPQPHMTVLLLQRVLQNHGRCKIRRVVGGRGIGTATLRKRKIFDPPSVEQTRKALIAFDAARLGVESVLFVTLSENSCLTVQGLVHTVGSSIVTS